jgi:hypothetical protein
MKFSTDELIPFFEVRTGMSKHLDDVQAGEEIVITRHDNLEYMRRFFLAYPATAISETLSRISGGELGAKISEIAFRKLTLTQLAQAFTLPWSAYVRLLSVKDDHARQFYETEALRGGWSVRQLDRQIGSQFYERTALSTNKAAMLTKGAAAKPEEAISPDEAVKDPYVLEFLNLNTGATATKATNTTATTNRVPAKPPEAVLDGFSSTADRFSSQPVSQAQQNAHTPQT